MAYKDKEYIKEHSKEVYYWLKENHVCVRCRNQTALDGKILCADCAEIVADRQAEYYQRCKKDIVARRVLKRQECKEKGICYICGKQASPKRKGMCEYHRMHDNLMQRKRHREKFNTHSREDCRALGICIRCCKKSAEQGYTYCLDCLQSTRKIFEPYAIKGREQAKARGWNNGF